MLSNNGRINNVILPHVSFTVRKPTFTHIKIDNVLPVLPPLLPPTVKPRKKRKKRRKKKTRNRPKDRPKDRPNNRLPNTGLEPVPIYDTVPVPHGEGIKDTGNIFSFPTDLGVIGKSNPKLENEYKPDTGTRYNPNGRELGGLGLAIHNKYADSQIFNNPMITIENHVIENKKTFWDYFDDAMFVVDVVALAVMIVPVFGTATGVGLRVGTASLRGIAGIIRNFGKIKNFATFVGKMVKEFGTKTWSAISTKVNSSNFRKLLDDDIWNAFDKIVPD